TAPCTRPPPWPPPGSCGWSRKPALARSLRPHIQCDERNIPPPLWPTGRRKSPDRAAPLCAAESRVPPPPHNRRCPSTVSPSTLPDASTPRTIRNPYSRGRWPRSSRGQPDLPRHPYFMLLAFGDHRETGQMPLMIQQQVQFDRSFGALILGPVKHRRTQANHRRIQAHQLVLKAKFLPFPPPTLTTGYTLALFQQLIED